MPTYIFTSPEGKEYEVGAPEGATQEQAFDYLQNQLAAKQTSPSMLDEAISGVKNYGAGLAKGALDVKGSVDLAAAKLLGQKDMEGYFDLQNKALNQAYKENFGKSGAAEVGRVAGQSLGTLPTAIISPFRGAGIASSIGNAALQGAANAALTSSASDNPIESDMTNQALASGVLGAAFHGAGKFVSPLLKSGQEKIAAELLDGKQPASVFENLKNYFSGVSNKQKQTLIQNLQNAEEIVPGSLPLASEVDSGGRIAAIGNRLKLINPEDFANRESARTAARNKLFTEVTPQENIDALKEARALATEDLYNKAGKIKVNPKAFEPFLEQLSGSAKFQGANNDVGNALVNMKEKIISNLPKGSFNPIYPEGNFAGGYTEVPSQPLINTYKVTRDVLAKKMGTEGALVPSIKGVINPQNKQFGKILAENNPALARADALYADLSKPINQKELLDEIRLNSLTPIPDPITGEEVFSLSKLKTQLKNKSKDIGMDLTESQKKGVGAIVKDLERSASAASVKPVPTADLQDLGAKSLYGTLNKPNSVFGRLLDIPLIKKIPSLAYGHVDYPVQQILSKAMLDPKYAASLIEKNKTGVALTMPERLAISIILNQTNQQ